MSHRRRRAPGAGRLALRQLLADPWLTVLVAVVVLLVTVVATAWPRVVSDMSSRQVTHVLEPLSPQQRDLVAVASTTSMHLVPGPPQDVEQVWGGQREALEQVRSDQPEPLRSALRPGHFYAEVATGYAAGTEEQTGYAGVVVSLRADPFLEEHVRLVEGEWPTACTPLNEEYYRFDEGQIPDRGECEGTEVLSVTVSADAAERLSWPVGEQRGQLVLTGVYEPLDPDDGYWQHAPNGAALGEQFDGNIGTTALVAGYLAENNPGTDGNPGTVTQVRYVLPLETEGIAGEDVTTVAAQLRRLTAEPLQLRPADPGAGPRTPGLDPGLSARFNAEVIPVFERLAAGQQVTGALLAVIAVGPAGVAGAVFALAARLLVTRRREALALARARGAGRGQLSGLLATEGLAVGLPAAALGYAVTALVLPAPGGWAQPVAAALVGAVPAVALAATAGTVGTGRERGDLGTGSRSRLRGIVEVALLALAVLAVWRLLTRAGGAPAVPERLDPLLVATPVLVALAAAALTVRVYPVPVSALVRRLRAGRGLTGFLGAARTVRDPAGGLLPALAVVLGVAVAVFAAVLTSTVQTGARTAAWEANGADIRVAGPRADQELVDQLLAVDGVAAAARVGEAAHTTNLTGAVEADGVRVVLVDASTADVQGAAEHLDPVPPAVADPGSGPVPVVTGGTVPDGTGPAQLAGAGAVEVVGHLGHVPGYAAAGQAFVVVDAAGWERLGQSRPLGNLVLLSVGPGEDREQVAQAVRAALPGGVVQTPQEQLDDYRASPVTSGLSALALTAVVLAGVLTALAIVLVQLLGAPARARLLAVLRTLGLAPGQGRRLTAWELAPLVVSAFAVGGATGLGLSWLVVKAVDLRSMTGGARQPELALDPLLVGGVLGGVLLVIALATLVSATVATRADITRHLRVGEER